MNLIVKKLGGLNAGKLDLSSINIIHDAKEGCRQAIVVSAIRSGDYLGDEYNTTNNLNNVGLAIAHGEDKENIKAKIHAIQTFHIHMAKTMLKDSISDLSKIIQVIHTAFEELTYAIKHHFSSNINHLPHKDNDYSIVGPNNQLMSISGFGEVLSSRIHAAILEEKGYAAESIDLSYIITSNQTHKDLHSILCNTVWKQTSDSLEKGKIPIITGYVGSFPEGIENVIGRGYSDATSTYGVLGHYYAHDRISDSQQLHIQKGVDGVMSIDPRLLDDHKKAKVIRQTTYEMMIELTSARGGNSPVVHQQTLSKQMMQANIPIHVYDPSSDDPGTIINKEGDPESIGVESVTPKDNIVLVSLKSRDMVDTAGFAGKLFTIVGKYFSINTIPTGTQEISFSLEKEIKKNKELQQTSDKIFEEKYETMKKEIHKTFKLGAGGANEYITRKDFGFVYCIGQNILNPQKLNLKAKLVLHNAGIPFLNSDPGIESNNFIMYIPKDTQDPDRTNNAARALHHHFIEQGDPKITVTI